MLQRNNLLVNNLVFLGPVYYTIVWFSAFALYPLRKKEFNSVDYAEALFCK